MGGVKDKIEAFDELYDRELKTLLHPLDQQRKAYLKQMTLSVLLLISIIAGSVFLLPVANYLVGIGVLLIGCYLIRRNYKTFKAKFASDFKQEVITKLIRGVDKTLEYAPAAGIEKEVFVKSGLFPGTIATYVSEDRVEGKIGDTALCFSEIHARTKTKDTGNHSETYQDLFKGLFFVATFNKAVSSRLFIYPDYFGGRLSNIQESLLKGMHRNDQLETIRLEDPEFEKQFSVFGTDQVDARYILSPSLMARLLELSKKYRYFAVSFADNQIYVVFHLSKNLFEPRILRSVSNQKQLEEYVTYIVLMVGIIDDLKLDYTIRD